MNTGVRAAACFYATDIHKGSLGKGMQDNSLARRGKQTGVIQSPPFVDAFISRMAELRRRTAL